MRTSPGAALDRQIEAVILTFARRDRPLLRLVPTALLRPVVAPTALRLRRSIVRGTLVIWIPAAAVLALWLGPGVASAASPSATHGAGSRRDLSQRRPPPEAVPWPGRSARVGGGALVVVALLGVSGSTISWLHGGKRRTARIV
jgi:hypothetical protein